MYTGYMGKDVVVGDGNMFLPLVPEAHDTLRRIMHNTDDEKLAQRIATSILDYAGQAKTPKGDTRPIIIKDSQIQLLVQVAKEVR